MLTLYTARTSNGRKISIALEELGVPYEVRPLRIGKGETKEPWFVRLNPNGRIPTVVEDDGLVVFESGAILVHLAETHGLLLSTERTARARTLSWLMFQMSGIGPTMGSAGSFLRADPPNPTAHRKFVDEGRRLLEVLDRALAEREFLAGEYSIADIATYPWVSDPGYAGIDASGLPNLARWLATMAARPAVARGMTIPNESHYADRSWLDRMRAGL